MEEWKEYKLEEIGTIVGGATPSTNEPHNYDGNISWITPKDLSNNSGRYISRGERMITSEGYNSCSCKMLPKGSVLFSSRAPIGYVAIASNELCTNQGFKSIIPNEQFVDSTFLYYLLVYNKAFIEGLGSGTTFKEVSGNVMKNVVVKIPCLEIQKQIANVLSSLDDKIEANRRINDNLEQQAQALFKSWFFDFDPFKDAEFVESELGMIPKGWRVGTLSDLANITMGTSPSGTSYNVSGEGEVFYQGRAEFGYRFPHRNMFTTEPKRYAEEGEVLLSVRAPVGDVNIANERCCIGRGLAAIGSNSYPSYILYLVKSLKSVFEKYNGEGTVFGSINKKALEGLRIIVPENRYIGRFEDVANSLDGQIRCKEEESRRLASLRDTLLPKLMSGELTLNNVNT